MSGKILVTDTGRYINHRLPVLKNYFRDVIVLKTDSRTKDIPSYLGNVIDLSSEASSSNHCNAYVPNFYQCIQSHTKEIKNLLSKHFATSLTLLCDLDLDLLYLMNELQSSNYICQFNLILPLPYGYIHKDSPHYKTLQNSNQVQSLAIYDPYKLAMKNYGNTENSSLEKVLAVESRHLLNKLDILMQISDRSFSPIRCFFDYRKDSYVRTDSLTLIDEHTLEYKAALEYIDEGDIEESDIVKGPCTEHLTIPAPRPDGKKVCSYLYNVRNDFALHHHLKLFSRDCSYDGPCGGTCAVCDAEAQSLRKQAGYSINFRNLFGKGMPKSEIMSISRLRINTDGEGISTLIGFWGCPLNCLYCLNPQCHRENTDCVCITPKELVDLLSIDDVYFRETKGGVVFGGGEPLLHASFIASTCKRMPSVWKKRIETCLNVSWKQVEPLIPYIDQWIIDIKDGNPDIYKAYTHSDGFLAYENVRKLSNIIEKEKIIIRIPYIPGYNTDSDVLKTQETYSKYGIPEIFTYNKR